MHAGFQGLLVTPCFSLSHLSRAVSLGRSQSKQTVGWTQPPAGLCLCASARPCAPSRVRAPLCPGEAKPSPPRPKHTHTARDAAPGALLAPGGPLGTRPSRLLPKQCHVEADFGGSGCQRGSWCPVSPRTKKSEPGVGFPYPLGSLPTSWKWKSPSLGARQLKGKPFRPVPGTALAVYAIITQGRRGAGEERGWGHLTL